MDNEDRRGIKAIEVAGRILESLARAKGSTALRELASTARMSPGKVHRYLVSFVASGLARQDPDTRKYELGPLALRLGLAALHSQQPLREAIALQHELRNRLDETLVLSVWSAQGPTIINIAETSQPIIMTMRVGAVLPMLATASGLAFAAFLPRHFTLPFIRKELDAKDSANLFVRNLTALERLTAQVRERGYAFNEGHLMPGVNAMAFPLFDRTAALVAVLAVMGRNERINLREGADLIATLKQATSTFGR